MLGLKFNHVGKRGPVILDKVSYIAVLYTSWYIISLIITVDWDRKLTVSVYNCYSLNIGAPAMTI